MATSSYNFIGSTLTYNVTGTTLTIPVSAIARDGIMIRNLSEHVVLYASPSSGVTEDNSIFEPILPGNSVAFGFRSGNVFIRAYKLSGTGDPTGFELLAHPFFESNVVTRMLQAIGTNIVNETNTCCSSEPVIEFCGLESSDASYLNYPQLLVNVNADLSTLDSFVFKVNGSTVSWITGTLLNAGIAGQQALGLTLSNIPLGTSFVNVYAELDTSPATTLGLFVLRVKGM